MSQSAMTVKECMNSPFSYCPFTTEKTEVTKVVLETEGPYYVHVCDFVGILKFIYGSGLLEGVEIAVLRLF